MLRALLLPLAVVTLLGCTAPMTSTTKTALFQAIEEGDIATVRRMVAATPALLDARDEYGFTPLMSAVSRMERTPQMVQALIEAGADVNTKTDEGYTALHMLVDVNGPTGTGEIPGQIARLLADAGVDTEVRQHWGWTPLMRAAVEGTADELQALVDVGGDVNKSFPSETQPEFLAGRTTLMATIGDPANVRIMIRAGTDLSATDAHGQTALEYARQCLADADEDGIDVRELVKEHLHEAMAEVLQHLQDAGIDPDAPMDDIGTTPRQSLEASTRESAAQTKPFDYAAEVRKSIELLEEALARQ